MYIKPRSARAALAFVGGLSISLLIIAGGYYWFRQNETAMKDKVMQETRIMVEQEWQLEHPMETVYVMAVDIEAGKVLLESDMVLRDVSSDIVPADTIRNLDDAIGLVARCSVKSGTLCTQSVLFQEGDYPDDARIQEYSVIRLPQRLEKSQVIDIRVMFPNGLDYVVLPKKTVLDLQRDESGIGNLVWLTMSEEELLRMSSAVVDSFLHPGTLLYAVTYVAPDIQEAAIYTYPANTYVQDLIKTNPNIVNTALSELESSRRKWFDSIPDPQPQQPLAVIPAPDSNKKDTTTDQSELNEKKESSDQPDMNNGSSDGVVIQEPNSESITQTQVNADSETSSDSSANTDKSSQNNTTTTSERGY